MVQLYIDRDAEDAASQFFRRSATDDMKLFLVTLCAVGCTMGEAPYPASGNRPQGALLEYGAPAQPGSTFQTSETEDLARLTNGLRQDQGSGAASSYQVFLNNGRLQGVHYTTASLRNGQQYTTASLRNGQQYTTASFRNGQQWGPGIQQFNQVDSNGINQNRLQQDYLPPQLGAINQQRNGDFQQFSQQQQNGQYFQQQQSPLAQEYGLPETQLGRVQDELQQQQIELLEQRQQQLEQQQQELRHQQEELRSASYLASIRYNNVDPITSPDYSYRPPTRVFRYAPEF